MKLLPISGCQAIVTEERGARLCGAISIAVIRQDDGQERFVCSGHKPSDAAPGPAWRLHRREVAPGPISDTDRQEWTGNARRRPQEQAEERPRKVFSAEVRKRIADGQRARWARRRAAKDSTAA